MSSTLPVNPERSSEQSEKEDQHWYNLGRSVGLKAAAGILAESARGYFAREQDQLAKAFRAEAKRLQIMADEARPDEKEQ